MPARIHRITHTTATDLHRVAAGPDGLTFSRMSYAFLSIKSSLLRIVPTAARRSRWGITIGTALMS